LAVITSFFILEGGMKPNSLVLHLKISLLYQPHMTMGEWDVGGMISGWGKMKYSEENLPKPLCPPKIPCGMFWD
jgi:hypothetical protein